MPDNVASTVSRPPSLGSKDKDETTVQIQPCESQQSQSESDVEAQKEKRAARRAGRCKLSPRVTSDAIIGLTDGLTVPFALTAGLSAFGDRRVVIFGGLAELVAGAISMGLGGYLGAQCEADSYAETLSRTRDLLRSASSEKETLVPGVFEPYQFPSNVVDMAHAHLQTSPDQMVDFIMLFHHRLSPPESTRPLVSAGTIACGYFVGGFIPLIPYFFVGPHDITTGLWCSCIVMAVALFTFGYVKTCVVRGWRGKSHVWSGIKGGVLMLLVGSLAAAAAVGLVKAFNSAYK
ncbi:MAG: hypothetical protein M1838_003363 [Thelocarpon superellum]|nr:MAG: hypothetical protein M1838_003363 [Thelocarpon superellum]